MASTQNGVEINGIWYNLTAEGNVAEVTSGDTKYSGNINIPATVTYEGVEYVDEVHTVKALKMAMAWCRA